MYKKWKSVLVFYYFLKIGIFFQMCKKKAILLPTQPSWFCAGALSRCCICNWVFKLLCFTCFHSQCSAALYRSWDEPANNCVVHHGSIRQRRCTYDGLYKRFPDVFSDINFWLATFPTTCEDSANSLSIATEFVEHGFLPKDISLEQMHDLFDSTDCFDLLFLLNGFYGPNHLDDTCVHQVQHNCLKVRVAPTDVKTP